MTDWLDALERLTRLHRDGALSDAEFAEQKARILDQNRQAAAGYAPAADTETDETGSGLSAGWLLAGLLIAALLGIVLWWRLVDDRGMVKPVPVASAPAAKPAKPVAAAAAAVEPEATAAPIVAPAAATTAAASASPDPKSAPRTFAPSFNCAGQSDAVLNLICGDRELARKDRILSDRFKAVLATLGKPDQQALLRRQREFLRERASCEDTACIDDWYDRVNEFYL